MSGEDSNGQSVTDTTSEDPQSNRSLTVLSGYPGVGKTFVSDEIAALQDGVAYNTDRVRKELTDGDPTYSAAESKRTYDELFARAEDSLTDGVSVVLDGTFSQQSHRDRAAALADRTQAVFRLVNVVCEDATTRERIRQRNNVSDAVESDYEDILASFEPFERPVLTIDNSGSKDETRQRIQDLFATPPG